MENPEQAKRLEDLLSFNTEQLSEIADARVILNKEWDRLQQNRSYLIKQIVEIRYTGNRDCSLIYNPRLTV